MFVITELKARVGNNRHLLEVDFSRLRWNKRAQRYVSPNGKFIDPVQVRKVIDDDIDATAERMRHNGKVLSQAARDYQDGKIDKAAYNAKVQEFKEEMQREVKNMHLANATAAKGGIASMDASAYGQAGKQLQFHYGKLDDFVKELQDNPAIATSDAEGKMPFERRLNMYAEAGRFTYETVRQQSHLDEGYKYAENILESGAHHCKTRGNTEGCLEQTAKGRVPINEIVMVGKRTCGPADRCNLKYFKYQKRKAK